jgi:hypothetical protein
MIKVLFVLSILALLVVIVQTRKETYTSSKKANITVYSGSQTSTGIDPSSYPIKVSVPGVGKVPVYPVAVHDDEYQKDKCKIIKVNTGKKSFYAHVINRCNRKDKNCKNRYKNGAQYLIDFYYNKSKDYKNRGLKYDVNKGRIQQTGKKVSALDLNKKKHWHEWLTKNHVKRTNGYTCKDCC